MKMRCAVVAFAVLVAACGPIDVQDTSPATQAPPADLLARVKLPIVGGTVDNGDPEAFMLVMQYSNGSGSGCTGTLIDDRTIATAAHCVDPRMGQSTSVQIWVSNKTYPNDTGWTPVIETRMHPSWNPTSGSLEHDIALMYLQSAPNAPKKPWNDVSLGASVGKTVRAVGYGITSKEGSDSGVKRHVELTVQQMDSTHLFIGDGATEGICHGDSGGPTFMNVGGVEKLVAIHSYDANQKCTLGGVIRTDAYKTFINNWLAEKEGPQCGNDGECNMTCNPFDADCYCLADNLCDSRCPNLLQDPDCPKDCVANNVCATQTCPTKDVDCVDVGDPCTNELQCQSRVCTNNPQHQAFYCSRACTETAECPAGMTCDTTVQLCRYPELPEAGPGQSCTIDQTFCTGGAVCTGPLNGKTTCQQPCATNADCSGAATCENGQGELKYCVLPRPSPLFYDRAKVEQEKTAPGCAAVGGGPIALLALGSLLSVLGRRRATR